MVGLRDESGPGRRVGAPAVSSTPPDPSSRGGRGDPGGPARPGADAGALRLLAVAEERPDLGGGDHHADLIAHLAVAVDDADEVAAVVQDGAAAVAGVD